MSSALAKTIKQQNPYISALTGDEAVAMLIWNTGPDGGQVIWNATKFTFYDASTGTDLDTSLNTGGTADGEITDAEAATLGAVVDLINADTDGYWHARILSGFRDSDTSDLLAVTVSVVGPNGIASGGGALKGGVAWDLSDLGAVPYIACIGPEMDTDLPGAGRVSTSNVRNRRDVLDDGFGAGLAVLETVARLYGFSITTGNGAQSTVTLNVYSANQATAGAATATLLYSVALTDDTLMDKTTTFAPPADIQSKLGERLVIMLTSSHANDNLRFQAIGSYGDPGQIDT